MKLQNSTDTRLRHKTSTPAQVEVSMKTHVTKGVHNCLTLCKIIEAIKFYSPPKFFTKIHHAEIHHFSTIFNRSFLFPHYSTHL